MSELCYDKRKEAILKVVSIKLELDSTWDKLSELTGIDPGKPLGIAVWAAFNLLIEYTSMLLGDSSESLSWFIWDNGCGKNGFECSDPDGRMVAVHNVDDLLLVLEI